MNSESLSSELKRDNRTKARTQSPAKDQAFPDPVGRVRVCVCGPSQPISCVGCGWISSQLSMQAVTHIISAHESVNNMVMAKLFT